MEYNSNICLAKDLVSIIDLNSVVLYDISKKIFIQNYTFTDEKIKHSVLKVDSNNNELIYLLVSDSKGFMHLINVNKREKVSKIKIHDAEIINFRVSQKKNLVYTLERSGILKVTDFTKGEVKKTLKLRNLKNKQNKNENKASYYHFDIDESEKNIVFNKNMKIKLFNLENNLVENIGNHSSLISYLKFSYDGKFIISMTAKDYFIYIWHKKSVNEPLLTLQQNSLTNGVQIKQIDRGVYHLFSYNKNFIYGYKVVLSEIDPNVALKPSVEIELMDKNLINMEMMNRDVENKNAPQSIFIIYGKAFNAFNLSTKMLKYAKNSKTFTESSIKISSKSSDSVDTIKKGVNISNNVTVLNEIQMGQNFDANENDTINSTDIEEYKKSINSNNLLSTSITDEKISLLNIIKNSIINNDNSTFEWALDQKDSNLIEMTIKKMDSELINFFISKLIEVFQSNVFFKHNMLPWLDLLFKHHMVEIVRLPKKTQNNLKNIKTLIQNRTKNLDRLEEISSKLENLMELFNKKKKNSKTENAVTYEPLLVYNESDSEDEKKTQLKEKMTNKGIKKTNETEFMEKKKADYEEDVDLMAEDELDIEDDFDVDAEMENEEEKKAEEGMNGEDFDEDGDDEEDD